MMCSMYCDPVKNLWMFLPDGTTDAEVLSLAATTFPEECNPYDKPTVVVDLSHEHATYPVEAITPSDFTMLL